jgi:hypothetical protein
MEAAVSSAHRLADFLFDFAGVQCTVQFSFKATVDSLISDWRLYKFGRMHGLFVYRTHSCIFLPPPPHFDLSGSPTHSP